MDFQRALVAGFIFNWMGCWTALRAIEGSWTPPCSQSRQPFGLMDLSWKEHRQVSIIGSLSLLLGIAFQLFWVSLMAGATAVLEHPAEMGLEINDPSIWRLGIVAFLLRLHNVLKVRVF